MTPENIATGKQHAETKIDKILSKLWVDGEISSYAQHNIMEILRKEFYGKRRG